MNPHRRFLPLAVLVAVAVISAAGFCLVHADHGGPEVCNALVGVTVAVLAMCVLVLMAPAGSGGEPAYALSPLDLAAPPPRA